MLLNRVEGGFVVEFAEGPPDIVATRDLVPLPRGHRFAVGDRVLALWKVGKLFPGTVTAVNADGRCRVAWDDGDPPLDVPQDRMTFLAWAEMEAASAPPPRAGEWIDVTREVLGPPGSDPGGGSHGAGGPGGAGGGMPGGGMSGARSHGAGGPGGAGGSSRVTPPPLPGQSRATPPPLPGRPPMGRG